MVSEARAAAKGVVDSSEESLSEARDKGRRAAASLSEAISSLGLRASVHDNHLKSRIL